MQDGRQEGCWLPKSMLLSLVLTAPGSRAPEWQLLLTQPFTDIRGLTPVVWLPNLHCVSTMSIWKA